MIINLGPYIIMVMSAATDLSIWFHTTKNTEPYTSLVEIASTSYMLHENMQANYLESMENSGSLQGNIL